MLEIRELTKYYRNIPVVDNVSFAVRPGEVTGYLGPNGSGKSTTVKVITALIEPSRGKVLLDGQDIRHDLIAFRRRLGYVPEEAILYAYMTGLEYLQLMGRLRGMPLHTVDRRANDLLELFSLHPHRHAPIANYSKGMKQRVLISAALLHDPDVLILDEPTSGLDPNQVHEVRQLIRSLGAVKTILLSTHILQEVQAVCSRVILINEGRVVFDGSVEEMGGDQRDMDKRFRELTAHASRR
jgi:ABC-2 type transport system ATP-binding protein